MVRCAFCGVEVGQWEGDDAFKDHQRCSPFCAFVKGLFVGNIPAPPETSQQQPSSSNDVCGSYMENTLKASHSLRCKYIFTFIYLCPMYNYNSTLIFIVFYSYQTCMLSSATFATKQYEPTAFKLEK